MLRFLFLAHLDFGQADERFLVEQKFTQAIGGIDPLLGVCLSSQGIPK
jgi:hypothetical protein